MPILKTLRRCYKDDLAEEEHIKKGKAARKKSMKKVRRWIKPFVITLTREQPK